MYKITRKRNHIINVIKDMGRKWPTVGKAEDARRGFMRETGAGC